MPTPSNSERHVGLAAALSAYLIWGFSPIYWKSLQAVPAFEILMHRVVWSFVFLAPLVLLQHRGPEFMSALRSRKTLMALGASTLLVSVNWFLFIWAINSGHILQTSLGYYIAPLVNVLLGMVILKERLRRLQIIALVLATAGVLFLTLRFGKFPWVSLSLAFSFGFYGLIRKVAPVGALVGLTVETLVLSLPAAVYLGILDATGSGCFLRAGGSVSLLLMGAALVTALPLLLFTVGARRLHYTTIGFLQYTAPSCTFLLATRVYREPLQAGQLAAFGLIWVALVFYSVDAARAYRNNGKARRQAAQRHSDT
ncbi:MAG: EamA family transporter RarD [Pseudomonadota bacterium]